jgi:parallel beta-helix repeat protein
MPAQQRTRGKNTTALLLATLLLAGMIFGPRQSAAAISKVTVTTTADTVDGNTASFAALAGNKGADGAVSLREALTAANSPSNPTELLIDFDIPAADPGHNAARGVWLITLIAPLPALSRGNLTLDAATQDAAAARPSVILDGYDIFEPEGERNGITITSANNVVRRLALVNFLDAGILISGAEARDNRVLGNVIGISPDADVVELNYVGVEIRDASDNQVGGTTAQERNVISGNYSYGILMSGAATTGNTVAGNWIGLGHNGATPLGNNRGIGVIGGASQNNIGLAGAGNVISANAIGVELANGAFSNILTANILGLGADGVTTRTNPNDESTSLGNTDGGVFIMRGAYENTVGGTTAAERNVIANNGSGGTSWGDGVYIDGAGTRGNRVLGNYIGVDRSGAVGRGNRRYGVSITSTAAGNFVGDAVANAGNVVAYNGRGGVRISSRANQVAGNLIGVGADRVTPLGNQWNGVDVDGEANVIGPGNLIAYNQLSGVVVNGGSTSVFRNILHDNDHSGICVAGSSTTVTSNEVYQNGGRTTTRTNCNIQGGIVVDNASRTVISANVVRDNQEVGIRISGGSSNRIQLNSISENAQAGIMLEAGGNQGIAAPVLEVTSETISGQACSLCTIEVFADPGDEGSEYVDTVAADAEGRFRLDFERAAINQPNITATTTDPAGNTSPFAAPRPIPRDEPQETPEHTLFLSFVGR